MSETPTVVFDHTEQDTAAPETGLIRRVFQAEIAAGEGSTVDVRIVPYGERITHNDGSGGFKRGVEFQEEWLPGVFNHQLNAANRVLANFEHGEGIGDIVARGVSLRDSSDGFHGSFKLLNTPAGDTMLELLSEGAVDGVSVEAKGVHNIKSGSLVQRAKANLYGIAFTRFAAYRGARVLALREQQETTFDAEQMPVDIDSELIARCRKLGIKLPQRYEAHPDDTGTPAAAGTP